MNGPDQKDLGESSTASLMASTRLLGEAAFLPAMSNAVPWSGEVRANGSPRLTFTPESKASSLNGIKPWS